MRSRKSAFRVAEQLAFHERPHQRRAVHHHKRPASFRVVNSARYYFLASARFAQDENRKAGSAHSGDELVDLAHHGRVSHQRGKRRDIKSNLRLHGKNQGCVEGVALESGNSLSLMRRRSWWR